jgi:quinoprotein glucose dehydrogenase
VDARQETGHDAREAACVRLAPYCVVDRLAFLVALIGLHAQTIPGALPESANALSQGQWPAYGGTYAAAHYSPLTQINRDNAKDLHVVWRWTSPDMAIRKANAEAIGPGFINESTPLMVNGLLHLDLAVAGRCNRRLERPDQMGV